MRSLPPALLPVLVLVAAAATAPPSRAEEASTLPRPGASVDVPLLEEVTFLIANLPESEDAQSRLLEHFALSGGEGATCLLTLRARFATAPHVRFTARALERAGDDRLIPYLLAMTAEGEDRDARAAAYAELGERVGPDEIAGLLLAMDDDPPPLRLAGDNALTAVLRRHPGRVTTYAIEQVWPRIGSKLRARTLACLGNTGSPDAVLFVGQRLSTERCLEAAALTSLARLPACEDAEKLLPRVREFLGSRNSMIRHQCVMVLARWEDYASIGVLIELLDDEDPAMRRNVHWTLCRISGMELPLHRDRWRVWYHREIQWWAEEGAGLLATLEDGKDEEVLRAIEILSRRPLFRRVIQAVLVKLATSGSAEVRGPAKAACSRLGVGGGAAAVTMAGFAAEGLPLERAAQRRRAPPPPPSGDAKVSSTRLPLLIAGLTAILVLLYRIGAFRVPVKPRRAGARRRG